jgi:hypothetical protein
MRRLCSLLAFLGFVGMMVGCHTAGACDCAGPGNACCYGSVGMPLAPTQWSPVATSAAGEPARAMPKADIKELSPAAPEKIGPPVDTGQ